MITTIDRLDAAVEALKQGEIVLLPTETIFGIAVISGNVKYYDKMVELKHRPENKSFPLAVCSIKQIENICEITPYQKKVINAVLPGPVTVILTVKESKRATYNNKDSIAIRYSSQEYLNELIKKVGKPIYLTSANLSGEETFTSVNKAHETFGESIKVYIDGQVQLGMASTIIDIRNDTIEVVRSGIMTKEDIESLL